MKSIKFILILFLAVFSSCGKSVLSSFYDSECNTKVIIRKDKDGLFDRLFKRRISSRNNNYYISFREGFFDEPVKVYINDSLYFDQKITYDESLGTAVIRTDKNSIRLAGFHFISSKRTNTLLLITSFGCLRFVVDPDYHNIDISRLRDNKWLILYDNVANKVIL